MGNLLGRWVIFLGGNLASNDELIWGDGLFFCNASWMDGWFGYLPPPNRYDMIYVLFKNTC